jgi:hypothetical protein
VIVAETRVSRTERAALAEAVRRRVQERLYLTTADVVLLEPGQLPKTTSGKLQRRRTREQYLNGELGLEGVRTPSVQAERLVIARHLALSLVSRVRHGVRSLTTSRIDAVAGGPEGDGQA